MNEKNLSNLRLKLYSREWKYKKKSVFTREQFRNSVRQRHSHSAAELNGGVNDLLWAFIHTICVVFLLIIWIVSHYSCPAAPATTDDLKFFRFHCVWSAVSAVQADFLDSRFNPPLVAIWVITWLQLNWRILTTLSRDDGLAFIEYIRDVKSLQRIQTNRNKSNKSISILNK